jgi:hypothetical protein
VFRFQFMSLVQRYLRTKAPKGQVSRRTAIRFHLQMQLRCRRSSISAQLDPRCECRCPLPCMREMDTDLRHLGVCEGKVSHLA